MGSELDLHVLEKLEKLGGEELVSKMVSLFTSHAESALRDAFAGLSGKDLDRVRKAAHALKSSAGNVGALKVQSLSDEIEQMAEQGNGNIQPLLTDLENAYFRAKALLAGELRERKQQIEDSDR